LHIDLPRTGTLEKNLSHPGEHRYNSVVASLIAIIARNLPQIDTTKEGLRCAPGRHDIPVLERHLIWHVIVAQPAGTRMPANFSNAPMMSCGFSCLPSFESPKIQASSRCRRF
jgi:hypothetical protein